MDHFKQVNDTYGHPAGDAVLKTVAARMKECLREYDYIGRYGGEEFMVVLGDADYETAVKTAERLNQAVGGETVVFGDKQLAVTISAGVAVAENFAALNPDQIVMAADQELYKAKATGRNRVEVCRI
ncbi:MAG: GGDEF domain-containing protein [Nitrosomonadales bacterium]|nr:GGDEF domain-containing protein [Nitrosomonadales bacterium]